MTTPHKATPEQWRRIEKSRPYPAVFAGLLELRDRIAALEAGASAAPDHLRGAPEMVATDGELIKAWDVRNGDHLARIRFIYNLGRQHGTTQAGGLVERVADAITDDSADVRLWHYEARAAILAVAGWFGAIGHGATASILRQEVERHG